MSVKDELSRHYHAHRKFVTYSWVGILVTIMQIALLYLFIDIWGIPTIWSSSLIVGGLFVFKYFLYRWTGFA